MNSRYQDRASINPHGIFVFKPLGTGLGLESAHEVRNAPGLWSSAPKVQRMHSEKKISALSHQKNLDLKSVQAIPLTLMGWQRFIALWCDVAVCTGIVVFALISAGFFLALGEDLPQSLPDILDLVSGLSWLRHSVQVAAVAASAPWWALLTSFGAVLGGYRFATYFLAGRSPGEALVGIAMAPGISSKAL
jgi:hypothetical protein